MEIVSIYGHEGIFITSPHHKKRLRDRCYQARLNAACLATETIA